MQTRVSKWGNSLALRLPKTITDEAHLRDGTSVDLAVKNGRLVISCARPRYELSDLIAGMVKKRHEAIDWGTPKGNEEW